MKFLTPANLPIIFIVIALVYLVNYLRNRRAADRGAGAGIAQRNRLRMAAIFGAIGVGQLVWRLLGKG